MNQLKIKQFDWLINELDADGYKFSTKKDSWNFGNTPELQKVHDSIFQTSPEINVTRKDCFDLSSHKEKIDEFILKVLYWGYPKGNKYSTPNEFTKESNNIDKCKEYLSSLYDSKEINISDLTPNSGIKGLGLSTISKFWFFLNLTSQGNRLLILDSKMFVIVKSGLFKDFDTIKNIKSSDNLKNDIESYKRYVECMNLIAKENYIDIDKLEFFLFSYGDTLIKTIGNGRTN